MFTHREIPVENDSDNGDEELIQGDTEWIGERHVTRIQMIVNTVRHCENHIHCYFHQDLSRIPILQ